MKNLRAAVSFVVQAKNKTFRNLSSDLNGTNAHASGILDVANSNVVGSTNNTMSEM